MMYQAVVILFMVGASAPMQVDAPSRSVTTSECFQQAAMLLSELVRNAPMPIISAQGFCLTETALKKKDKMQSLQPPKKEKTREQII